MADYEKAADPAAIVESVRHKHWLKFNDAREIVGCQCGEPANPDDHGWGDSILEHIAAAAAGAAIEHTAMHILGNFLSSLPELERKARMFDILAFIEQYREEQRS